MWLMTSNGHVSSALNRESTDLLGLYLYCYRLKSMPRILKIWRMFSTLKLREDLPSVKPQLVTVALHYYF